MTRARPSRIFSRNSPVTASALDAAESRL
jgi:hypothetical protein